MSTLEPSLTAKSIRNILKHIGNYKQAPETPLSEYVLVRQQFHRPETVKDDAAINRLVGDLVTDTITELYAQLRQQNNLPMLTTESLSRDEAIAIIQQEASLNNDLLMGASTIYYQFLQPGLGLDLDILYNYFPAEERTIQRRRNVFLDYVCQHLIAAETAARNQFRQTRCRLSLPRQSITPLNSQTAAIEQGVTQLQATHALAIFGRPNSGKTTIATQIAKQMLDVSPVRDIAWVSLHDNVLKPSLENLLHLTCRQLHITPSTIPERDFHTYLATFEPHEQMLLIFDAADAWGEVITAHWHLMSQCLVILTMTVRSMTWPGADLPTTPIEVAEARQLVRFLAKSYYPNATQGDLLVVADELHDIHRGNVGDIRQAFRISNQIQAHQSQAVLSLPLEHLSRHQRDILGLFAVWPSRLSMTFSMLQSLLDEIELADLQATQYALISLIDMGYLRAEAYQDDVHYLLDVAPAQLLDTKAINNLSAAARHSTHAELSYYLLNKIIFWQQLPVDDLLALTRLAHQFAKQHHLWRDWYATLQAIEPTLSNSIEHLVILLTKKVSALRWLGQFHDAQDIITEAVTIARDKSLGSPLAEALLEQARLLHYNNEDGTVEAHWAGELFTTLNDQEGIRRALFVLARLWLHDDVDTAENYLNQISPQNTAHLALLAEIKMLQGDTSSALIWVRRCLRQANEDEAVYARLLNLLAQILVADGQRDEALIVYENAINHAQRYVDWWSLARLHTNIAAHLMADANFSLAHEHLTKAVKLYQSLQDDDGLRTAEENLALLQTLL